MASQKQKSSREKTDHTDGVGRDQLQPGETRVHGTRRVHKADGSPRDEPTPRPADDNE
jgi:hypothetical protein